MDALTLVVAALGGGVVATILSEWLRSRREYDEARLLVLGELLTIVQIAKNVLAGRFTAEWAAAAIQSAAWETYQVRLVRRLNTNRGVWGALAGVYSAVDFLRVRPEKADIGGLERAASAAHSGLDALGLRRLGPKR
jgi:hypothetical protein